MKLILEKWNKFLKENEDTFFSWLNDLKALEDPNSSDIVKAFPNWQRMGCGAYRCVYLPKGEKDYVVKVVREKVPSSLVGSVSETFLTSQNKAEFDISREFPLIFPKVYAHHPDFNWVVMDKVEVVLDSSLPLMESLEASFPKMIKYIFDMYSFPRNVRSFDHALQLILMAATFGTKYPKLDALTSSLKEKYIKGSAEKIFDFGIKNSETFRELHRAVNEYGIEIGDVSGGNVGRTSDGRFVIIDASVWEPSVWN